MPSASFSLSASRNFQKENYLKNITQYLGGPDGKNLRIPEKVSLYRWHLKRQEPYRSLLWVG
jgi:hypothetical protein